MAELALHAPGLELALRRTGTNIEAAVHFVWNVVEKWSASSQKNKRDRNDAAVTQPAAQLAAEEVARSWCYKSPAANLEITDLPDGVRKAKAATVQRWMKH
jgi:hypothetical protein